MKLLRPTLLLPFAVLLPVVSSLAVEKSTLSWRGAAHLHTISTKNKSIKAKVTYPTLASRTPLSRFVTQKLTTSLRGDYSAWLKSSRKDMKENPGGMLPYEYEGYSVLKHNEAARLITLRTITYQYLGGAHGSDSIINHNFALVNGKPKDLTLSDLFVPGTAYRKLVETKILDVLKKNPDAAWIQDKSVKTITNAQFANFLLEKDSVTWLFQEYEMGPFAAGTIEAKVPISELGPGFKKSLLPR